ncbi:MAG: DUF4145 domain-containing protein [Fimbriimonadales bacterium]
MNSWWDLGEGMGFEGMELALYRITCPFCLERGNFSLLHRTTKKKPNGAKTLYGDTYRCGNCAGFVMVLWSASGSSGIHGFRVLPWPLTFDDFPEHWPQDFGRYWLQAHRNLRDESWDAAAVMSRSAMQFALRKAGAQGANLRSEIDDLAARGILPPLMKDWAHEVRELGNDAAHPEPGQPATTTQDAADIVEYLDFLARYMYNLPNDIAQYRERKA